MNIIDILLDVLCAFFCCFLDLLWKYDIDISLSAEEEVEELELGVHSRLLMLCKEHLNELFDKFEISKDTLQNETRLQLAKLLFNAVGKEHGKLKAE